MIIKLYLTAIKSIYSHFEINIGNLPYISTATAKTSQPIYYDDLNAYPQQRENIKNTDKLFKLHERYFSMLFANVNDTLQLGNKGEYKRFRPHMLRKFHASQLYIAGMDMTKIDALQGRGKTKTHKAYFKDSPSFLKEEYIKCLPYLLIDDIEKAKTELEQQKEENKELKAENQQKDSEIIQLKENQKRTDQRLDQIEKTILTNINSEKLQKIKKII